MATSTQFRPYTETTIDGVIDAGYELDLTESTIAFKEIIDDSVIIQYNTLISKYLYAIQNNIMTMTLSDSDLLKYKYKPKLLSYELYGTPELAYSILYINNMASITEFNKKKIKIFTSNIMDIINELLSLNQKDLEENETRVFG